MPRDSYAFVDKPGKDVYKRQSANRQLQEEVDAIILSLLEIIEDDTYTLAVATHEDNKDAIITCITRESYGKTFTQRAREYPCVGHIDVGSGHRCSGNGLVGIVDVMPLPEKIRVVEIRCNQSAGLALSLIHIWLLRIYNDHS